jgi:hypothetical protein
VLNRPRAVLMGGDQVSAVLLAVHALLRWEPECFASAPTLSMSNSSAWRGGEEGEVLLQQLPAIFMDGGPLAASSEVLIQHRMGMCLLAPALVLGWCAREPVLCSVL